MVFEAILTGVGYPCPSPGCAGPGVLVRVAGSLLQFDCGRGTVMRLADLGYYPSDIHILYFTHYHSDHISDLTDFLATRWILNGKTPLLIGPEGLSTTISNVQKLLSHDIIRRSNHVGKEEKLDARVFEFDPSQAEEIPIGEDVVVRSQKVDHGYVSEAVGYRIEYEGKSVVISGDTTYSDELLSFYDNADILIHEVLDQERAGLNQEIVDYHSTPEQVAELASQANVRKLVLTHIIPPTQGAEDILELKETIKRGYSGEVVIGKDLTRLKV